MGCGMGMVACGMRHGLWRGGGGMGGGVGVGGVRGDFLGRCLELRFSNGFRAIITEGMKPLALYNCKESEKRKETETDSEKATPTDQNDKKGKIKNARWRVRTAGLAINSRTL